MVEWSKALPLTASFLSLLPRFESHPAGACEKVANDLGQGSAFHRVLQFPPLLTTG